MLSQAREDARDLTAAASPTAEIATERLPDNGGEIWRLSGPWINTTAVAAGKRLDKVAGGEGGTLEIDLSAVEEMDTAGAWLLRRAITARQAKGAEVSVSDRKGTRYIDCAGTPLDFGARLRDDVRNRTATAMTQDHCFRAMELALEAHRIATPLSGARPVSGAA